MEFGVCGPGEIIQSEIFHLQLEPCWMKAWILQVTKSGKRRWKNLFLPLKGKKDKPKFYDIYDRVDMNFSARSTQIKEIPPGIALVHVFFISRTCVSQLAIR